MIKNRYKELVLKADEGITFKICEGEEGQVIIRALNHFGKGSVYSKNYVEPPIPEGYKHIEGKWHNGFVIERCSDGSQFVWVPVGFLDSDGTLDGDVFIEKFGRRNFMSNKYNQLYGTFYAEDEFSEEGYYEELNEELSEQLESVKKYGGFYISRYNISKGSNGKPQSVKGFLPWVDIKFAEVKELAASIENSEAIRSHLTYGAEYDSVLAWFIKSKARTAEEIAVDSEGWGYYFHSKPLPPYNIPGGPWEPIKIIETGSSEKCCTNNIYDFAGNVGEWTQEQYGEECDEDECEALKYDNHVIRGNCYKYPTSSGDPVGYRNDSGNIKYAGFRAVLCIK